MSLQRLDQIVPETTGRMPSTFDELDWAYGKKGDWGIPRGRISVWAGQQGVGKTRLLTQMMKGWDGIGLTSLICQGEVSAGQFAAEKMGGYKSNRIWVTPEMDILSQIEALERVKPAVMITDSVQQVEQYKNGRGAKDIVRQIRQVISGTGTHVIFISQMTTEGKTKGGTTLPHECDIEAKLVRWSPDFAPDIFMLTVEKNRYGSFGRQVAFCHKDWGVECQSKNRLKDNDWRKEHGMASGGVVSHSGERSWIRRLLGV
jgi:predicted ATP-dependent serine protease